MKTALFLTDCSIDSALTLRNWMSQYKGEAIQLTVVHPYALANGSLLTKETHRTAKQQAQTRLQHWSEMLPSSHPGMLLTETLFGDASLVFTIHLQLRRYTYVLLDFWQEALTEIYTAQATPHGRLFYIDLQKKRLPMPGTFPEEINVLD
ncbi:hypothetical protein [Spirosoma radiotolerans]|uniref:hypothetical protein n=1 Tax=Spirosoma radiotolerans TaxID=1379870 RepID=UPI0006987710|nr:hypothetical protein [Spirosoma radiotolerans]